MSTLDTLIVWNDQQLAAFRESGASSTYELFVAKPELFPKEVQDTYFGTVERITAALIRPNTHKMVRKLLKDMPPLAQYLNQVPKVSRQERLASIRHNTKILDFLKAVQSREVTLSQFQGLIQAIFTTDGARDILLAMSDFSISFCQLLREIYPEFTVKSNDKIVLKDFPGLEEGDIEAEWLIDQIFHTLAYQMTINLNYAHVSGAPRKDLEKLN